MNITPEHKVRQTYAKLREKIRKDARNYMKCFGVNANSCRDDCSAEIYYSCEWAWKNKVKVEGSVAIIQED